MNRRNVIAVVFGALGAAPAAAQLHTGDYAVQIDASALQLGGVVGTGAAEFPFPLRSGVFGNEGFANFTNDPGVDSVPGALIPGMAIGFDVTAALREWDGTDFDTISDDTVSIRDGGVIVATTPPTDSTVAGTIFGTADSDSAAVFHHHVQFFLNYPSTTPVDGVWLFTWDLWTDEPGIERSGDAYIVFAQGTGTAQLDDAVAWVEDNLLASPCVADCDGSGTLNLDDIDCFVAGFLASDLGLADCDGSGTLNLDDIDCFVSGFLAGCP
ncbi:MAG: hypothetical protein RIB60_02065 [Phycisphaerales bacterium]